MNSDLDVGKDFSKQDHSMSPGAVRLMKSIFVLLEDKHSRLFPHQERVLSDCYAWMLREESLQLTNADRNGKGFDYKLLRITFCALRCALSASSFIVKVTM